MASINSAPPELFLSDAQLASRYGTNRATPWRWSKQGGFPQPVKLGPNLTRWKLSEIEAWETQRAETAR